ncbi:leucyl aminopeptidase [bacterium CG_4_9_14_3_um_filter_65_15]|nr:MAG: leucyl aminopeptidase [bacterium CG_4_9_14_3_um_filter_65_15]
MAMQWTVAQTSLSDTKADLIVYPVFQTGEEADLGPLVKAAGGPPKSRRGKGASGHADLGSIIRGAGFNAAGGATLPVPCSGVKAGWFLLVGMGKAADVGLQEIRKVAAAAAKQARTMQAVKVAVVTGALAPAGFDAAAVARSWHEGAEMALSPTGELKTSKEKPAPPRSWILLAAAGEASALRAGLKEGQALTAGCLFARDLVNLPPNLLTPAALATRTRGMARREGLRCKVLGVPELKKLKMGGLLGVGQGSVYPPRLIVVDYKGSRAAKAPTIALVGKGVTFDSGGISLKPSAAMDEMKSDMAGAAGVLGAVLAIARMKLPVNVQVVVPTAENMPDGNAIKPADVLTMASGKTVEVLNTDAEGRLILADALWYAGRGKPDYLLDMATLTGACVVALGKHFAGIMGNSAELTDILKQAGGETFERVWPLPLVDEHKEQMKGTWADLQNIGGGREGGALTAAAFLAAFVDDKTAWTHLDIAGPAYSSKGDGICPAGGTGFGARLLARTVQLLAG